MNYENLIISDDWSLDDNESELKIVHRRQESVYVVSPHTATFIHVSTQDKLYFVFDGDEIVLMYDAATGIIYPLTVNEENILCKNKNQSRKLHVWQQFTQFLFGEFLRNCGLE